MEMVSLRIRHNKAKTNQVVVGIIRTMVAELVPEKELQPRAFSIMPLVWSIGSVFGPAFGGFFARPVERRLFGGMFENIEYLKRYPFALPNLVACFVFFISFMTGLLFLKVFTFYLSPQHQLIAIIGNSGRQTSQTRLGLGPWGEAHPTLQPPAYPPLSPAVLRRRGSFRPPPPNVSHAPLPLPLKISRHAPNILRDLLLSNHYQPDLLHFPGPSLGRLRPSPPRLPQLPASSPRFFQHPPPLQVLRRLWTHLG
jgi:hypothetical protein